MKTGVEILTSPILVIIEVCLLVLLLWAVTRHPDWAGVRPTSIVFVLWLFVGIGMSAYSLHQISGKSHRLYRAQNPREYEKRWTVLLFRATALVFLFSALTFSHVHPQPVAEMKVVIQAESSPQGM